MSTKRRAKVVENPLVTERKRQAVVAVDLVERMMPDDADVFALTMAFADGAFMTITEDIPSRSKREHRYRTVGVKRSESRSGAGLSALAAVEAAKKDERGDLVKNIVKALEQASPANVVRVVFTISFRDQVVVVVEAARADRPAADVEQWNETIIGALNTTYSAGGRVQ